MAIFNKKINISDIKIKNEKIMYSSRSVDCASFLQKILIFQKVFTNIEIFLKRVEIV